MFDSILFACFMGTWVVLGITSIFLFYDNKNTVFKRKWFPRFVILVGILFMIFSTASLATSARSLEDWSMLAAEAPIVAIITYLNIKLTRFCDNCGSTLIPQIRWTPIRFCPKCGAELGARSSESDDLAEHLP